MIRTLKKGESFRGLISRDDGPLVALLSGTEYKRVLKILTLDEKFPSGEIDAEKVEVRCVPKDSPFVREHFSDLPELDYEP